MVSAAWLTWEHLLNPRIGKDPPRRKWHPPAFENPMNVSEAVTMGVAIVRHDRTTSLRFSSNLLHYFPLTFSPATHCVTGRTRTAMTTLEAE